MYRAVYRFLSHQMKTPSGLPLCCRCDWVSHTLARFLAHRAVPDCTEGNPRRGRGQAGLSCDCGVLAALLFRQMMLQWPLRKSRRRCPALQSAVPRFSADKGATWFRTSAHQRRSWQRRAKHKWPEPASCLFVARKSPPRDCLRPEPCFAGCLALARPPLSDRSLYLRRRLTSAQFLRRHELLVGAAMGFTMPGRPIGDLQDAEDMMPREAHHLDRCVLNSGGSVQLTGAPPAPVAGPTPVKAVAADMRPAAWTSFANQRALTKCRVLAGRADPISN